MRRLIIRPGAIGDFILSLPAMECLRTPDLEVWAASKNLPLARFADRSRAIPSTGLDLLGVTEPPASLLEALRGFDSIVSWYGANRPEFRDLVERLGLPFTFLRALPPEGSEQHAADFYLEQARSLQSAKGPPQKRTSGAGAGAEIEGAARADAEPEDAEPEDAEPEGAEPDDAEPEDAEPDDAEPEGAELEGAEPETARAAPLLRECPTPRESDGIPRIPCAAKREQFAVIHPFSSCASKNWPMEKFRQLARGLERTMSVRWCAGPEDPPLDGAVRIHDLYELACWLGRAGLYVGNDSGITHLAAAVGTPVLVIFGPSDPRVWAPRGQHVRVVRWKA